jgi:hypothetical protein
VKSQRFFFFGLCFLSFAVAAFADDDNYILEQARRRAARNETARDGDSRGAEEYPYTPVVFALTPGLSYPVGTYDASAALGAIGSLVGAVSGVQASGVFGLSLGDVRGLQHAGVFNIAGGEVRGLQSAGVFNIAEGPVSFVQAAGVFNISEAVSGLQAAGLFNIAESFRGVQAAGLFNIADAVDGVMLAGLFNVADSVDGMVVGVVNIVDEMDGIAIGVINVIGNGVHDFSVDYQTAGKTLYFGYRTGTRRLYASFFGGIPREDFLQTTENATLGLGLGRRRVFGPFSWDFEAGIETPLGPRERDRFGELAGADPSGIVDAFNSLPAFATLRTTLDRKSVV